MFITATPSLSSDLITRSPLIHHAMLARAPNTTMSLKIAHSAVLIRAVQYKLILKAKITAKSTK